MTAAGETVWLVQVTEQQSDPPPEDPTLTGYQLYATEEGAQRGLREMFRQMGVETMTTPEFDEETGSYTADFNIDGRYINYLLVPLGVNE